ncbi:MAG: hypothetical protein ACOY4Q_01585 [Bacillota bacterium]
MEKTVIGVFTSRDRAEKAVDELRAAGYDREISILARNAEEPKDKGATDYDENSVMFGTRGSIATGAATGGAAGAIAGLAIGAGALAIPGLGAVIAAGPIAGLLSGAATGGIAGGLVDWGIPRERGGFYEGEVKEGNLIATVRTSEDKTDRAASVMKENGARNVEIH